MKKQILIATAMFSLVSSKSESKLPNIIFVYADQWRAQAVGYNGNSQVKTPNLDALAEKGINMVNTVSNIPVSCPARASLLTGQYPLTHGVFYNDKPLRNQCLTIAEVLKENGYQTAYIGKWHLNGRKPDEALAVSRVSPVPKERRQGFDYWKVLECTHDYNNSIYFDEDNVKHEWEGYDAFAQTKNAISYIKKEKAGPFFLFLSLGPPHSPYQTAPEKYMDLYRKMEIDLRPNVPVKMSEEAKESIKGYYAHCSALDHCIGELLEAINDFGIEDNTIFVFTSDHGDMLYSHGGKNKQQPWDESVLVPFLLRYPKMFGNKAKKITTPFSGPDIMPTVLSMAGIKIPQTVEGIDFSSHMLGEPIDVKAALITCPVPFHQWNYQQGGREYRGVRTERYTYVRDLNGPWLLYDNQTDHYQMNNCINKPEYASIQAELEIQLQDMLKKSDDEFREGKYYVEKWGYSWDGNDSVKKAIPK